MIGEKLHQAWGQAVVVENRAGANGNIGSNLVAKAKTDGYTLLLTDVGALCISASVFPDLPFDPVKDFEPVTMVSYSPHVFAVHPSVPAKTVKEFIELAKSQPGKLNLATAGAGSAPHLAGVEFAARTGVQWTYIHYKGGSQAIADVVAGHANVLFNGMLPTFPYVKGGQLRALAVTSTERLAAAPEIPTMQESGLAGFETGSWQGVLAPRGTPREIVGKLNAEIRRILNLPDVRKMLASQGADVRADTPEVFGRFLASETARWARIVKQAGVKAE
jgi:tripartite-type tricarboxylate transporter receptor subunit TctC